MRTEMVVDAETHNIIVSVSAERGRTSTAGKQCVFGSCIKASGAIASKTHIIVFSLPAPMLIDHVLDAGTKKPTLGRFVAGSSGGRSPTPTPVELPPTSPIARPPAAYHIMWFESVKNPR